MAGPAFGTASMCEKSRAAQRHCDDCSHVLRAVLTPSCNRFGNNSKQLMTVWVERPISSGTLELRLWSTAWQWKNKHDSTIQHISRGPGKFPHPAMPSKPIASHPLRKGQSPSFWRSCPPAPKNFTEEANHNFQRKRSRLHSAHLRQEGPALAPVKRSNCSSQGRVADAPHIDPR